MVSLGGLGGTGVSITINAIDNFSRTFRKMQLGLKEFSKHALTFAAIGGGIAAGLGLAVKTSIDFESAFTGVRKTVELTEKEFGELENRFKTISTETGTTFIELSRIGEIAGQLGVEGVDNLDKFTRVIADIAVTTNMTAEEAAVSFARIANVMGEPISEVDRMGAAIVDLGNNFATSEQEIVNMSMRIMGAGKTIGLNTQEVFGMSAALSALGIRSEMGGSAISRAMITISKSVAEGSDELAKYAEVSGMSIDEFSVAWKDKPVEALSKVIMGLKNISETGGNTFGVLADLDLKSIRITDTMLRLAGSQDGVTKAVNMSKDAWEENTALTEEAQKRYATMEREIAKVKARFAVLGDEIGDRLVPFIRDYLLPAIDKLISFWQGLSPEMQNAILLFAAVTAGVFLLAGAIALATLVASPWLLILLGIAAVIAGVILIILKLKNNWETFVIGIKKLMLDFQIDMIKSWGAIKKIGILAFEGLKNVVISIWNFIVSKIADGVNSVISSINVLIRAFNRVAGVLGFSGISELGAVTFGGIKGGITDLRELAAQLDREVETDIFTAQQKYRQSIQVNIENLQATDAESVAEALEETLGDKI